MSILTHLLAVLVADRPRDERGLSQSTEQAILLAGAVTVALLIVTAITAYVSGKLAGL